MKKRLFRLSIDDDLHLVRLGEFTFRPWQAITGVAGSLLAIFLLSFLILAYSPLRSILPGSQEFSGRADSEENLMRLDSLIDAFTDNQAFLDNYFKITNITLYTEDTVASGPPISGSADNYQRSPHMQLEDASPNEKRFVRMMEEHERFNISVLAPLAAEGMIFSPLSTSGTISSSSRHTEKCEIILPAEAPVLSSADAVVASLNYDSSNGGYTIILQHSRGFLSIYSRIGTPLVDEGDAVAAGQVIALTPPPDTSGKRYFHYRLLHNRLSIKPAEYVDFGNFN